MLYNRCASNDRVDDRTPGDTGTIIADSTVQVYPHLSDSPLDRFALDRPVHFLEYIDIGSFAVLDTHANHLRHVVSIPQSLGIKPEYFDVLTIRHGASYLTQESISFSVVRCRLRDRKRRRQHPILPGPTTHCLVGIKGNRRRENYLSVWGVSLLSPVPYPRL